MPFIPFSTSYLLSQQNGTYAAYSLRKLISTAIKAIRVRRTSDNAEQDVGFVGNNLDTISLLSFVGSGSGYVKTWYEQSGSGYDVTQTTTANQPRIVNAGVLDVDSYGKPTIVFDGTNDILANTTVSISNLCTYCLVAKNTGNDTTLRRIVAFGDNALTTNSNNANYQPNITTIGIGNRFPESQQMSIVQSLETQSIISYTRNSTTSQQAWVNGVLKGTNTNPTTTFNGTRISVGGNVTSQYWQGSISEIIIFNPLSNTQRQKIETNQIKYYAIS